MCLTFQYDIFSCFVIDKLFQLLEGVKQTILTLSVTFFSHVNIIQNRDPFKISDIISLRLQLTSLSLVMRHLK